MYSKTCLKRPLKKKTKIGFQDRISLNAGQNCYRMILQYFRPSISYHLSLRSLFCLFLSGRLVSILLTFIKLPFVIKIVVLSIFSGRLRQVSVS